MAIPAMALITAEKFCGFCDDGFCDDIVSKNNDISGYLVHKNLSYFLRPRIDS